VQGRDEKEPDGSMKKFIYYFVLLFLSVLGVTFTIQNPQDAYIQYYLGLSWHGPLVIIILASLVIGIAIGLLTGFAKNFRLRRKYSRLLQTYPEGLRGENDSTVVTNLKT
jgi:uncharacterized integral membrane protein